LKLKCDILLSTSAFKSNLHLYEKVADSSDEDDGEDPLMRALAEEKRSAMREMTMISDGDTPVHLNPTVYPLKLNIISTRSLEPNIVPCWTQLPIMHLTAFD